MGVSSRVSSVVHVRLSYAWKRTPATRRSKVRGEFIRTRSGPRRRGRGDPLPCGGPLLKYVLVTGHAVPASGIEVNAEDRRRVRPGIVRGGDYRVRPYSGRSLREFDRTLRVLRALRRARVVKSPPSAIGRQLARVRAGTRPCRPLCRSRYRRLPPGPPRTTFPLPPRRRRWYWVRLRVALPVRAG